MKTVKVANEAKTVKWNGMPRVEKPWGAYTDLFRTDYVVFKQIVVNPLSRLSLQKHDKRGEFWFVVKGDGFLVYGDIEHRITEGSHVEIPVGMVHCLVNDTSEPLMVYEMQFGTCSEDDIVRLDDEYGRANDESLGMGCPRKICDVLPKGKKNA